MSLSPGVTGESLNVINDDCAMGTLKDVEMSPSSGVTGKSLNVNDSNWAWSRSKGPLCWQ